MGVIPWFSRQTGTAVPNTPKRFKESPIAYACLQSHTLQHNNVLGRDDDLVRVVCVGDPLVGRQLGLHVDVGVDAAAVEQHEVAEQVGALYRVESLEERRAIGEVLVDKLRDSLHKYEKEGQQKRGVRDLEWYVGRDTAR